jgi:hypothetical protein
MIGGKMIPRSGTGHRGGAERQVWKPAIQQARRLFVSGTGIAEWTREDHRRRLGGLVITHIFLNLS